MFGGYLIQRKVKYMFNISIKNLFAIIVAFLLVVGIIVCFSFMDADIEKTENNNFDDNTNFESSNRGLSEIPSHGFSSELVPIASAPTFEDYLNPDSAFNLTGGQ